MGRGMTIAVLAASVVGSVVGGLAALHSPSGSSTAESTPAAPVVAQPAPASAGSAIVQAPDPPPPPDPLAAVTAQMKVLLAQFAGWARDHAGAPCPEAPALAVALDPWGHQLAVTCTDQPADQRVGAVSAGPDGITGNDDDVASWNLGREVTDLVRGPRWKAARPAVVQLPTTRRTKEATTAPGHPTATSTTRPVPSPPPPAAPTTKPSTAPLDAGTDDIPARR
jgi:hypothetical protein